MLITLLSLSVSASILIAMIFIVTRAGRKRISRTWQYYIWLLVFVRLLAPFALPVNLTGILFRQTETLLLAEGAGSRTGAAAEQGQGQRERIGLYGPKEPEGMTNHDGVPGKSNAFREQGIEPETDPETDPAGRTILFVWCSVTIFIGASKTLKYRRYVGWIKNAGVPVTDETILSALEWAKRRLGISGRERIPVYHNPEARSPMLAGLLHPVIIIVEEHMDEAAARSVFLHELAHFKRKDILYKWAVQAAVCVFWFDPFFYLMRRETQRNCELSCDEAVIARLNAGERRAYGSTLLASACPAVKRADMTASVSLSQDAGLLKERLGAIMVYHKKTKAGRLMTGAVSLALCAGMLLCGYVQADAAGNKSVEGAYAAARPAFAERPRANGPSAVKEDTTGAREEQVNWKPRGQEETVFSSEKAYYRELFFRNQYVIDLAWNVDTSRYPGTIANPAPGVATLSFSDATLPYARDSEVMAAVEQILSGEKAKDGQRGVQLSAPVLLRVTGPLQGNLEELLERYYLDEEMFLALIKEAPQETKDAYLRRAYAEDREDYYAVLCSYAGDALLTELIENAFADGRTDNFVIAADKLSGELPRELMERAYLSGDEEFFMLGCVFLSEKDMKYFADKAYADHRIDILAMLDILMEE